MKRLLAVLLTLTLVLSLAPAVMAAPDDNVLTENGGYEENFYRGQPKTWDFTPSQTATYLLSIPSSGSLIGQIVGQTPTEEYDLQTGQHMLSYDLTGGKTYQVKIEMNPDEPGNMVKEVFNIVRKEPMERLVLSTTTLTMQRDQYESLYVEIEPAYYPLTGLKWASSDSSILEIDSTEGNTCGFWARKVGTAKITATVGDKSASCTVTVEKATGEWDNYEVWPASQTKKKMTMTTGQPFSYTPTQTGTYALHTEGDLHVMMRGTLSSHMLNSKSIDTMEGTYNLVDLIAGETYVFEVNANSMDGTPCTGTAYIEKAKDISNITLYGPNMTDASSITGYVGGMKDLFAVSDPIYAFGLHGGFHYTSTNSSVAAPDHGTDVSSNIILHKEGTSSIIVSCGPVSKTVPVTVKPSPVLKAGTTMTLKFAATDAYGVTCLFTPEKSATYTFTVKGTGGTCYIEDTNIGAPIYGSGSMSGWLQAGKTYEVILGVGESDHTVSVSGGGAVAPTVPTDPTVPTTPNQPTVPDQPTTPGQSTIPTDPNQPTDSNTTVPSQPATPSDPELENLAQQMGGSVRGENICLEIDTPSVDISVSHLAQLAEMDRTLEVLGYGFMVKLDSKALDAIVKSGEETVTLQVQTLQADSLTQAQKDALKDKNAAVVIGVDLTAGDQSIHDFAGGTASVIIIFPLFNPESGKTYEVFYLAQDGTLEKVASTFTDASMTFTTGHFSEYVILEAENSSVSDVGGADAPEEASVIAKILPWALIALTIIAVAAVVVIVVLKKKK